ncbi:MAG: pectate lyase [Armatimonadota bacterium]
MTRSTLLGIGLFVLLVGCTTQADVPAFPGAEGFGATTPGGRGGQVIAVTNLDDSGPGSLRAAVETSGPRIIVFQVGGTIELQSELRVTEPFCTIAGQSAPGGGICLMNHGLAIRGTHDVVVRYLRVRPGDLAGKEVDGISVHESERVVIDHCSASWGVDEVLSVTRSEDVTVQWSIISESLHDSVHGKGPHGMGSLLNYNGNGGISFHHNIYAHHNSRNPRPGGLEGEPGFTLDFRNHVIYNWGSACGYNDEDPQKINYVANYLRPGPSTRENQVRRAFRILGVATSFYAAGNVLDGYPEATDDNWLMIVTSGEVTRERVEATAAHPAPPITEHPASELLSVLARDCGATLPVRDAVDARVIDTIISGTGSIINSQNDVGGWPELAAGEALDDSDGDGMPDVWEIEHGLDPHDPTDGPEDLDGDGYTNVEEFLNGTDPRGV